MSEPREVAGTYVFERTSVQGTTRSYALTTLTLRPDWSWSESHKSTLNGRPAANWVDSGSFSVHRERVVVLSQRNGIRKFRVVGDTLWSDRSEDEAMERVISGETIKLDRFYFVRRRSGAAEL
jgi:hypothetical protein